MLFSVLIVHVMGCYNVAPGPAIPSIEPEFPVEGDDLQVSLDPEAEDYNGDDLNPEFRWFKNDDETNSIGAMIEGEYTISGDVSVVKVSFSDGRLNGPWIPSAPVEIQ